jgi:hypothetical protein
VNEKMGGMVNLNLFDFLYLTSVAIFIICFFLVVYNIIKLQLYFNNIQEKVVNFNFVTWYWRWCSVNEAERKELLIELLKPEYQHLIDGLFYELENRRKKLNLIIFCAFASIISTFFIKR